MRAAWDMLQRSVRVLLTAAAFTFFFVGGAFLSWVLFPLLGIMVRERRRRAQLCRRILKAAFRLFHGYMRFVRILHFSPSSVQVRMPSAPCMIVANHPTLVDVTALLAVLDNVAVVSKPAMYRSPLVGRLLRVSMHIEGARDAMTDGVRVLEDCRDRLAHGQSVLIFPEGTRSPVGGLGPFKRGVFEIAARLGVPVCMFGVRCAPPVLSRQHPWWTTPRQVPCLSVFQMDTVAPEQWDGNVIAMARDVRACYEQIVVADAPFQPTSRKIPGLAVDTPTNQTGV